MLRMGERYRVVDSSLPVASPRHASNTIKNLHRNHDAIERSCHVVERIALLTSFRRVKCSAFRSDTNRRLRSITLTA